jgi:hypothetical protein
MCSDQWFSQKQFPSRLSSYGIWCTLVWWEFTNISEESAITITLKVEINISSETIVYSCQIHRVTFQQTVIFTASAVRISAIEMSVLYAVICTRRVQKKDRTFTIKTLFYNILITVPFKVVPSNGDTLFPTFLQLLECFLERTFCDGAHFSCCIFLNLRVFKKRPNFLNRALTSTEGARYGY